MKFMCVSCTLNCRKHFRGSLSQPESRELFYLVGIFRTQHLSSSGKTAPGRYKGKSGYIQVCSKGSRQSEHQRSGIGLRIQHSTYGKMQASPNSFLSYAPQLSGVNPVSLFSVLLAFPQLLSGHCRGWQHPLECSLGSPQSPLEARNH